MEEKFMAVIKRFLLKIFRTYITRHKIFMLCIVLVFHLLVVTVFVARKSPDISHILMFSFLYFPLVM